MKVVFLASMITTVEKGDITDKRYALAGRIERRGRCDACIHLHFVAITIEPDPRGGTLVTP